MAGTGGPTGATEPLGTVKERREAAQAKVAEAKAVRAKAAAAKRRRDLRAKAKAAAAKVAAKTLKAPAKAKAAVRSDITEPGSEGNRQGNRWTDSVKEAFFGQLALTANVRRSAQAAGVNEASAYRKKRKEPAFAQAWGIALAEGYSRIELMLVERALASADEVDGSAGASGLSDRVLMTLYIQHRQSVREVREAAAKQGVGTPPKVVRARLGAKLAQMHVRIAGRD